MAVLVRTPIFHPHEHWTYHVQLARLSVTRATIICIFLTVSSAFDVPVYWPILVLYFCVLFVLTMRRQIQYVYLFAAHCSCL